MKAGTGKLIMMTSKCQKKICSSRAGRALSLLKTVSAQGFDIAAPAADAGFDALSRAHSVALARLSDEIVVAIRNDAMAGG